MQKGFLTQETLAEFLEDGDAIINFGSETVAVNAPALSLDSDGNAKLSDGPAYPVRSDPAAVAKALHDTGIKRCVVVTDDASCHAAAAFSAAAIPHVVCVLEPSCDAESFMDDEDSEAVAERLRQLGYI